MFIENLKAMQMKITACIESSITWENKDCVSRTIFCETDAAYAGELTFDPRAFLVGSLIPAVVHGEGRAKTDKPIYPELYNGLLTNDSRLHVWCPRTELIFADLN